VALGVTAALLVALLGWQYSNPPSLERSSLEQKATATVQNVIGKRDGLNYLDSDIRFTQTTGEDGNQLLAVVYVQDQAPDPPSPQTIQDGLSRELQQAYLLPATDEKYLVFCYVQKEQKPKLF